MKKVYIVALLSFVVFASFIALSPDVNAAVCPPGKVCNPINADNFREVVLKVATVLTQVGLPLAVVFLLWSGFLFVSSRGNEQQIETAKKVFMWTIIGAIVLIGARVIAEAVVDFAQKL